LLEIDNRILQIRSKLSSLLRANPSRSTYLAALAKARYLRYELTNENEDLEESISRSVEAILSFDPQIGHNSDVVTAFVSLAASLLRRSHKLKRPDDSKHCITYLRYLRDQSLESSHITGGRITTAFTRALANGVQMASINPMRNIEEKAILCREFLRLDASDEILLSAAETLVWDINIMDEYASVDQPPPDQVIQCLREANIRFPDSEIVSLRFLYSLFQRFIVTHSHGDYEDAMSIADGSFTRPPFVKSASLVAAVLARARFTFYGNPEYLEEAIFRMRIYLRTLSSEDPDRQEMTCVLKHLEKERRDELFVASCSRAADATNTEVNNHTSPSHLVSPLPTTRSDIGELTPVTQDVGDPRGVKTLLRLLEQTTDRARIEEAIEFYRRKLESSQPSDFHTSMTNYDLAQILIRAFHCTDDMAYLNESITLLRGILNVPVAPSVRLKIIERLLLALFFRLLRLHETIDAEEMMQLFPIAAAGTCAKTPVLFRISCKWAVFARYQRHPSTSTAYEKAISLMKDSLAFGPTLEMQHYHLVSRRVDYETLPLDYASHQIDLGQLEQAIETLERGRGLIWSEMRGLRMSIHRLRLVNLPLAERFAAINHDLEVLTTSSSAGIWPNEGQADSDELMDPIGRLVIKQRTLVAERDRLI